jgi:hypothetical protein
MWDFSTLVPHKYRLTCSSYFLDSNLPSSTKVVENVALGWLLKCFEPEQVKLDIPVAQVGVEGH